jgi:enoyl-CoA hydratase/carnithine racemase
VTYQDLRYEVDGGVATITLDRPEVRNALRGVSYAELTDAVRAADGDPGVRCLVVTGTDPAFCSGDDVRDIMAGEDDPAGLLDPEQLLPAAEALLYAGVPVIAAVNGAAVGWGVELALMADLRIASARAVFSEMFVDRGLTSDIAGLGRLAQLVGREKAAELLLTGSFVDAAEALRVGLVGRLVAHEDLLPATYELARRIAAKPPQAVRSIKAGLRRATDPDWRELHAWVSRELARLFATADHKEAVAAFLEKRSPVFTGR